MPATQLRRLQTGLQTVWGTSVASTAKFGALKEVSLQPDTTLVEVKEAGRLGPSAQTYLGAQQGKGKVSGWVTYEQITYMLALAVMDATPSGAGPYLYTYTGAVGSVPTPDFMTWHAGPPDSGLSYKATGVLLNNFTCKYEAGGLWEFSADAIAKQIDPVVGTLVVADPTTNEYARAADTILTLDPIGGTLGATAMAGQIIGAEFTYNSDWHLKQFGGASTPSTYGIGTPSASCKIRWEWNATVKAFVDALVGQAVVQKKIRARATSGAKVFTIDFIGTMGDPELFTDRNGNVVVELPFGGLYGTSDAEYYQAVVTNASAALT